MPVPDYQSIMLPLLKFTGDKKEHSLRGAVDYISNIFNINEEDKKQILPSGQSYVIDNRVGWAVTYLKKAGLLESTKRACFKISNLGLEVLNNNPTEINTKFLMQFPSFVEFRTMRKEKTDEEEVEITTTKTPEELLEYGCQRIQRDLSDDLLNLVKHNSPRFFERLVIDLLLAMGYGGSFKDAGQAIGQSGDNGVDGFIKEDKLGLDTIYVQAKRWENVVGSKEVRNFIGGLAGQKANKGVFITTSRFTDEAIEYLKTIPHKVILIDGETLIQFMIENNIGVSKVTSYEIKKIDSDYFNEG